MILKYKNRNIEIDGIKLEIGEGAYIQSATYIDTGIELTDDEIYELENDCQDLIYDAAYQNAICTAEYAFEGDR